MTILVLEIVKPCNSEWRNLHKASAINVKLMNGVILINAYEHKYPVLLLNFSFVSKAITKLVIDNDIINSNISL